MWMFCTWKAERRFCCSFVCIFLSKWRRFMSHKSACEKGIPWEMPSHVHNAFVEFTWPLKARSFIFSMNNYNCFAFDLTFFFIAAAYVLHKSGVCISIYCRCRCCCQTIRERSVFYKTAFTQSMWRCGYEILTKSNRRNWININCIRSGSQARERADYPQCNYDSSMLCVLSAQCSSGRFDSITFLHFQLLFFM